jgi:predicted ArsR family transcriptional regulator
MPSKKQPSTSKSPRRVHNKSVASVKRPLQEARPTTKKQQLIGLLSGGKPVTADKVGRTLDWQPHTVRAAMTGLRKAGFVIDSKRGSDGSARCYQIVSQPQSTESAA